MSDRRIVGDTQAFEYQLKWEDGAPVDLTGASTVYFIMRKDGETTDKINAQCTITDAANGKVAYLFSTADVNTAGMYKYRYVITYTTGKILSVPSYDILWLYMIDTAWM